MSVKLACTGFAMLVACSAQALATPVNLVTNGSFEQGTGSAGSLGVFTGWTTSGTSFGNNPGQGPERITYGNNATGYGDNVSADPFTNSPDASGNHAAFFVDDQASETLSQKIAIVAGVTYEVGFDFFETNSGAANPNPFTLSASLNGTTLATVTSGVTYAAGTWYHVFETFNAPTDGTSGFSFTYNSGTAPAKDVIVDDVYVEIAPPSDIVEPASAVLMAAGLMAFATIVMRRRSSFLA